MAGEDANVGMVVTQRRSGEKYGKCKAGNPLRCMDKHEGLPRERMAEELELRI